jgi:peptide/nickel transport system substrate-binding protein
VVADTLARVGVRATPRFVEWGTMVALQGRGDFDAIVSTWREPTQVDLEDVWHSAPPGEPTSNFVRYSNPEVDRLIARVGEEPDFSRQKPLFDRIQELVVADQPYTFLYERHSLVGISSRIGGAELNDATPYFNLEEWYLRAAEGSDR